MRCHQHARETPTQLNSSYDPGCLCLQAPELFQLPRKSHPMQFKDDPDVKTCDEKVDVWAVGVLVFELVYGAAPFAAKQTMQTVNLIMKGFDGKFPKIEVCSASCLLGRVATAVALPFGGHRCCR